MSASVDLYIDLVAAAYDATTADNAKKRAAAYYTANKRFAFAAALRLVPRLDISKTPACVVLAELTAAATSSGTGELNPGEWYLPAIEEAQLEFGRYKNYVDASLAHMRQYMAVDRQFERWADGVKLTEIQSPNCWMWRRIKTHTSRLDLDLIGPQLQERVLCAKTPTLPDPTPQNARAILLSSARVFMEMTKAAVRDSLHASLCEAVKMRLHSMTERTRPTPQTAGQADLIPDFTPMPAALREETETIFADYTNLTTLTQTLTSDADEAERQYRRQPRNGAADLFNQHEWFQTKLCKLADETRDAVLAEDDDNHLLQETVDDDLKSAFDAFGSYLAQKYIASQTAIVRNELAEAADMAALVLPEQKVHLIVDAQMGELTDREAAMNEATRVQYEAYEKTHAPRVYSYRTEQQHLASRSDASAKMEQRLRLAATESKQWLRPNDKTADNIKRLLTTRISLPYNAPAPPQRPDRLTHCTRLLLFCRELADSITEIRRVEIERLESELRSVWDTRTVMLSELTDAVASGGGVSDNVNDEPWESRLPVLSARADIHRLLPSTITARLCQRLRSFAEDMTQKVQRPLPIRPRGTRDHRLRVLADLRELAAACDEQPLKLDTAWLHLPCVLWSETYVQLVDSVNVDQHKRHATSTSAPAAKRVK